ncbi:RNA polymerase sigma-D factor [Thalassoglobus neptunius]|uniref:RNA polymerase sigma-D factor n=1 Tax=Thalassoglobus neptunius TaxID=1938619 RepID=A0A5C5WJ84_9PLAN|nr:sigma-70 family RNA polymerase sigma factor [Thalassoglobus neptunius]TWT50081.1 RNA polymerase sigma-D factor [Thalassoglobus neptunius]
MTTRSKTDVPSPRDLVNSCQGLVRSIAWKLHQRLPKNVDLDDLIGFGQIGLSEAARDFDVRRGVNFSTYAYYRIRGSILDGLGKMSWFSKADFNRGRYEQSANDVLATSSSGGANSEDLSWFASTTNALATVFLVSQLGSEDRPGGEAVDNSYEERERQVEQLDLLEKLRELIQELPDQQREIVEGVYYDGLTIKAAGERVGISKAWASRVHKQALETLMLRLTNSQIV